MCCIYYLVNYYLQNVQTYDRKILKIFVYGLFRDQRREHTYVRHKLTQVWFPRIHTTWDMVSTKAAAGDLGKQTYSCTYVRTVLPVFFFFNHQFHFPAQLVGGFTLSELLDKPWSQVSSLLPPGTCLQHNAVTASGVYQERRQSCDDGGRRTHN